jgi:putative two-component system response regulator
MTATILLVVADGECRKNWRELLSDQGYRIVEIGKGERVLDLCPHLSPDLVLIDAHLPDVSGFEICRRLKEDRRSSHTPVVLITTLSDDRDSSEAQAAGADDFWGSRPSRWEALTRVRSLLQLKTYIDEQSEAVIVSLARSIEARDPYTQGHCERISILAVKLGKRIGLREDQCEALRLAGLVHDIGKVVVPDAILLKPGRLSLEEMQVIRQHPVEGERICSPLKSLRRVLPIVRHHHERMDGSGYPDGLRGDKIPLTARILQIADIYDALTTDRPYREGLSLQKALETMYEEGDRGWIDLDLIKIFGTFAMTPKTLHAMESRWQLGKLGLN